MLLHMDEGLLPWLHANNQNAIDGIFNLNYLTKTGNPMVHRQMSCFPGLCYMSESFYPILKKELI